MIWVFSGLLFLVFDFTVSFGQGSWELDLVPDLLRLVLLGLAAVDLVRVSDGPAIRLRLEAEEPASRGANRYRPRVPRYRPSTPGRALQGFG